MVSLRILIFLSIFLLAGAHRRCCQSGEIFSKCGGLCDLTCAYPKRLCPEICVPGCICKPGLLRDTVTGKCVAPCDCCPDQICCKDTEAFSKATAHCEGTCEIPQPPCPEDVCNPGCICKPGYLRNTNTTECIPEDECPKKEEPPVCKRENEVFVECLGHCDNTCAEPVPACPAICMPGCICKEGYLRDSNTGNCVPEEECPEFQKCRQRNQIFSLVGGLRECQGTCSKPNPVCVSPNVAGCICREGFLRNDQTGVCILPQMCPQ